MEKNAYAILITVIFNLSVLNAEITLSRVSGTRSRSKMIKFVVLRYCPFKADAVNSFILNN